MEKNPRYWRGIHRSTLKSPHKGQWCETLVFSLICAWKKQLSKQSRRFWFETPSRPLLSGVPDFFDRNKILSGYDLSIIKCLIVLEFSFILFDLWLFITIFNFILNYVPVVTFWILTYHKIWILLIIFCFIWSYWIVYFLTCLEVFWSVVS